MITTISRITLYVNNQAEAKAFWIDKVGFQVIFEHPMGESTWLEVGPQKGGTRFVLYEKELMKQQNPKVDLHHPSLILSTLHIEKTYQTLKDAGVEINEIMHFPYGKMCNFHDPDGNVYMLREDQTK